MSSLKLLLKLKARDIPDCHFGKGVTDVSILSDPVDRFPEKLNLSQWNTMLTKDQLPGSSSVDVRPGPNVIELVTSVIYKCLHLAGLSSLAQCLWVRPGAYVS